MRLPKRTRCEGKRSTARPCRSRKTARTIATACGPLRRMTPRPPAPIGVAIAAMVWSDVGSTRRSPRLGDGLRDPWVLAQHGILLHDGEKVVHQPVDHQSHREIQE